jgi:hypothetical protein
MSHDLLDDLLADVPRHVSADAAVAWRAGCARRRRRHVAEALAVAAAIVLVGIGLVQLHDRTPVEPVGPSKTVSGYPRSVPRPFFEPALPVAPGPAVGVVAADGSWHLIGARGRTWRLPEVDVAPALSEDGVWLAMMRRDGPEAGHVEVRNLATGSVESYAEVGESRSGTKSSSTGQGFWTAMESVVWSPDGSRLLTQGGIVGSEVSTWLLLEDGSVTALDAMDVLDTVVGWTSPSTIAWLEPEVHGNDIVLNLNDVVVTDLDGHEVSRVRLQTNRPLAFNEGVRLSPDGDRFAMVDDHNNGTDLRVFALATGIELPRVARDPEHEHSGPPLWRGDDVLWWRGGDLDDPAGGPTVVSLSDKWSAPVAWAQRSLAGPEHDGPSHLGWRYWPVWWWWKKILVGLGVALAGLGLWRLDRWDVRKHLRST